MIQIQIETWHPRTSLVLNLSPHIPFVLFRYIIQNLSCFCIGLLHCLLFLYWYLLHFDRAKTSSLMFVGRKWLTFQQRTMFHCSKLYRVKIFPKLHWIVCPEASRKEKIRFCLSLVCFVSRKGVCDENVFSCAGLEQAPMLAHRLLFMQRLLEGRGVSCFAIVRWQFHPV